MTLQQERRPDLLRTVDTDQCTVDRRIFFDQDIYELELERIFARAWNFMAHDSMIPNPGDFFMTFIGEDRVICVRDNEGNPQVLVNSCRHRGNAVCRAEEGHATSFMCTYHGWTYDLKGALVGVPGFKEVYHEELDRENWGLIRAAKVDSYKGFIFATMDPDAPDLDDYLGDVGKISLSFIAERDGAKVVPGVQKYIIPCNWKFAVDNVWDYYHGQVSHASADVSGYGNQKRKPLSGSGNFRHHLCMLGEYGHIVSGPLLTDELGPEQKGKVTEAWRLTDKAKAEMGPAGIRSNGHPHVFPNLWITQACQVGLRLPRGPKSTEIWWFSMVETGLPQEDQNYRRYRANHTFGPAGMLEQDDGENWGQSTRGMVGAVSTKYPLHYGMSHSHDPLIVEEGSPPYAETNVTEHAQLWHYRAWAEWMAAGSWDDLRANHSQPPTDVL
jgi:phenylpropionate dioxygenase-like ring-hydroxylating dioxygenase large terminal subunit